MARFFPAPAALGCAAALLLGPALTAQEPPPPPATDPNAAPPAPPAPPLPAPPAPETPAGPPADAVFAISNIDPFPLAKGSQWTYRTNAPDDAMVVDVLKYDKIGEEIHALVVLSVLRNIDGKKTPVPVQKEWFRKGAGGDVLCPLRMLGGSEIHIDPPQVHVRGGLGLGATWAWDGRIEQEKGKSEYRVEADEVVKVPAGEFKAFRIRGTTQTDSGKSKVIRWLAPGVGMVKEEIEVDLGSRPPVTIQAELTSYRIGPPKGE